MRLHELEQYRFIDIHYHADPDLYRRSLDVWGAGKQYQALQGAVFLKSHLGATSIQAQIAQHHGLPVFPSVALNAIAGGIDYRVICRALAEYKAHPHTRMLVDFPTITGRKYTSKLPRQLLHPALEKFTLAAETVFDERQQLRKEVIDILKMARDYPIVLTTGHACKEEIYALIEACSQYNVPALLLNQPANPLTGLPAEELRALAKHEFVWIEQTFLTYVLGHQSEADFLTVLASLPRVIYSSDLGQPKQMGVAHWINHSRKLFTEFGISVSRQDEIMRRNPISLLAI
ncbi:MULTISPECIES: DUF6282 family protein [Legionella]|uniref:DUF6282 family protein n=1 Tax=Legionella TaxID=445 RepID=UPI002D78DFAC|nr:DUF6282 family protein [Legionella septentrionalis]